MFVIVTYDIGIERINKVRKLLKMYLTWTQNSVFEGEITESKLKECLQNISLNIDKKVDSIYIYKVKNSININKNVFGKEKNFDELFL